MKKVLRNIIFVLIPLLLPSCSVSDSDIVTINDVAFLNALVELGVDRNSDGIISRREAEKTNALRIWPSSIEDLSGIEAFLNLDTLSITMNPIRTMNISQNKSLKFLELIACELSSLDVSANHELEYLDCSSGMAMKNYLSELNVSENTNLLFLSCIENKIDTLDVRLNKNLEVLRCGYNELKSLDVSQNTNLVTLTCNNNQLTFLDLSKNAGLTKMISCGNKLSYLDISKNTGIHNLGIDNMPMLRNVCVWTMPFPPAGVTVLMGFSPNVVFSLNCEK